MVGDCAVPSSERSRPTSEVGDAVSQGAGEHAPVPATGDAGQGAGEVLAGLDDAVQRQVVALAAAVLGDLPAGDLPARLRPFARFAPRRRAELAAPTLLVALDDAAFRGRVARALGERVDPPADASRVALAAVAWLRRSPG